MRKLALISVSLAALSFGSLTALADNKIVIKPGVDAWVMKQQGDSVDFKGDIVVGGNLPDTVKFINVPDDDEYAYAVVNKKRVLVNRNNRIVVKVYD
jgi:hypothetical protein